MVDIIFLKLNCNYRLIIYLFFIFRFDQNYTLTLLHVDKCD